MRALATSISMYVCTCTYRNSINKCTTIVPSAVPWGFFYSNIEGAQAKLSRTPTAPPPRGPKIVLFRDLFFHFVSLLGGSFLGCALVNGLPHTLALTKRLGKQANIARARDVKLYFGLFMYVNPCVNARWSMYSEVISGGQAPRLGTKPCKPSCPSCPNMAPTSLLEVVPPFPHSLGSRCRGRQLAPRGETRDSGLSEPPTTPPGCQYHGVLMGSGGEQAPGQPNVIPRSRWERRQASYRRDHSRLQRRRKYHPYQCPRPHNPQARSQLPSQPRQRNCPRRTTLNPAHNSRRHHVSVIACAPAASAVYQHRRPLRAVRGALRLNKVQQCAPAPHLRRGTSTPVDTRWSACNLRH